MLKCCAAVQESVDCAGSRGKGSGGGVPLPDSAESFQLEWLRGVGGLPMPN